MSKPTYLFSIDLEDVRMWMENGSSYQERVIENTSEYLNWLNKNTIKTTFFTVGDIAERYPELIQEIVHQGHEIGCHTNNHKALDLQTKDEFKLDLEANMESLLKAGAKDLYGFRAPIFSLTEKTSWAYEVLNDLNFEYSSSVLPAKNPLYGWEDFGYKPKYINGILEIPMTLYKVAVLNIPIGGGTYFRLLPSFILKKGMKSISAQSDERYVTGYFHPYDIDVKQERFMHPGINNSKIYNMLMYVGRKGVFSKLDQIKTDYQFATYKAFADRLKQNQ